MAGALVLMMLVQSPEEIPMTSLQSCQHSFSGTALEDVQWWLKHDKSKKQQRASLEAIGKGPEEGRGGGWKESRREEVHS